jgi:predicted Rossmann fold nucleotide-binding protein DprA/Smf involved in DNA uptake
MDQRERQHKIAWMSVPGIGRRTLEKLREFKASRAVSWNQLWHSSRLLLEEDILNFFQKEQLILFQKKISVEGWFDYLGSTQTICEDDELYPLTLKRCPDHPPLLFIKGSWP